ncbi:membrane fusion protein, multidrug efflux system [Desulfuromusa kysingii]|uniref:Membrane fusion protein, multidrug efflux system n=1 Tax=Desulfuromusa kysingii TaxID=37625 RepID=A0A1H4DQ71_9BACT|nr:efflux RND transporter periplasmic adaptor subunit [Desulfuromusa kysingii]SEA74342.1 membrane fusion protein, multidrug efflux system [Desulfuromusa kysingii]
MKIFEKSMCKFVVIFVLLGLVSGCSREDKLPAESVRAEKIISVAVEPVVLGDLTDTFTLPANLEAWEDITLSAEVSGGLYKINFAEGDQVAAGQVLLEIDPETVKTQQLKAQNDVNLVQSKIHRYQQLIADGLVSQQELEDLENRLVTAKSTLLATELQLQKSFPQAPVNGTIDRIYVDRGEYVSPGMPLLQLVQVDQLKVIADIPEKDVQFLHIGDQVQIIAASIEPSSASPFIGVIEHIAITANPTTRTYRTKIIIDNRSAKLRPGMIVRAKFVRQQLQQVISVPLFAVIDREGEKFVYINDNGRAKKTAVVIGRSIGQRIVIEDGLEVNQSLIVAGQQLLIDGNKVEVGVN